MAKANISLVQPGKTTKEIQELYDRVVANTGRVSPIFRVLAHKPEYLKSVIEKFELLWAETKLDMRSKHLVYLTVSIMNNSQLCIYSFTEKLKSMGVSDEEFVELYGVIDAASGMNAVANGAGISVEHLQEAAQESKG